jgi:hypothetical protein
MASTSMPLSPAHGAAMAHISELRAEAERRRRAGAVRPRRRHSWPVNVGSALRDSVAAALPPRPRRDRPAACPTC